jgi:hypothetical protein
MTQEMQVSAIIVNEDGTVTQEYALMDAPPPVDMDELLAREWAHVRQERNRRLAETDWVVVAATERNGVIPENWSIYRQALRDITKQPDPLGIVWPTPPNAAN